MKVLFYTQNRWAFGSIHHALCKELYKKNIYANLLDWTQHYTDEEFKLLNKTYDVFVTNPEAVVSLHYKGIPLNKIVTIAHGQWDLLLAKQNHGVDFYNHIKGYGVISEILKSKSSEFGISRVPTITKLGIHFDMFYDSIHDGLSVVGYAGQKECLNFFKQEIKRAKLVEEAVQNLEGIKLVTHGDYNHLCMPGYYKDIDCLLMASTEEAGGLPVMEAAAAGRLVMGTPVGYFEHNANNGAGIELPMDQQSFIHKAKEHIVYFRDNPNQYRQQCQMSQEFARQNYDWSVVIDKWLSLLTE
jgi:glycosyltransferase involved in cell wall biosynthesis